MCHVCISSARYFYSLHVLLPPRWFFGFASYCFLYLVRYSFICLVRAFVSYFFMYLFLY